MVFLRKTLLQRRDDELFPVIVPRIKHRLSHLCRVTEFYIYIQLLSTSAAREDFPDPLFQPVLMEENVSLSYSHIMRKEVNHECYGTKCS